jgi:hypothetical protein
MAPVLCVVSTSWRVLCQVISQCDYTTLEDYIIGLLPLGPYTRALDVWREQKSEMLDLQMPCSQLKELSNTPRLLVLGWHGTTRKK